MKSDERPSLQPSPELGSTSGSTQTDVDGTGTEIFSEWLRRQGHKVFRTHSSCWYDVNPRVYQAFPFHLLIQPSDEEIRQFLKTSGAIALRFFSPHDSCSGCASYYIIHDQPEYRLDLLDRRARQNVRTGTRNCVVEKIAIERLAEEGWSLEADTVARQGRREKVEKEAWMRYCLSAADLPGFEAWGAIVNGKLAATLFSYTYGEWVEFLTQQCHRDYLCARVNNALIFSVTETMLQRPGVKYIYYTHQSLDAPPSIDEFKLRMGYTANPVRQRILFHPLVKPLINKLSHRLLKQAVSWFPGSHTFGKTEGMVRYYLEGCRPPEEQEEPECLKDHHSQPEPSDSPSPLVEKSPAQTHLIPAPPRR